MMQPTLRLKRFTVLMIASILYSMSSGIAQAATGPQVSEESLFLIPVPVHQSVEVIEVFKVTPFAGGDGSFQVYLPQGASGIQVNGAQPTASQLSHDILTLPHVLNSKQATTVSVQYLLGLDAATGLQFTLHSPYPVYAAHVYLPIGNTALSAQSLLTSTQTETISGTQFRVFSRLGIPAGDNWTLSLQVLPTATPNQTIQGLSIIGGDANGAGNNLEAIGNLLLAVAILAIGLIGIRSSTANSRQQTLGNPVEALFQAWTRLELDYEAGRVSEEDYSKRRQDMKRRIEHLQASKLPATAELPQD